MLDIFELLNWITTAGTAIGFLYLALKKVPSERASLRGSGAEAFAKAAAGYADENISLQKELSIIRDRLEAVEHKKYRITIEFTIGDPPQMGMALIEPVDC